MALNPPALQPTYHHKLGLWECSSWRFPGGGGGGQGSSHPPATPGISSRGELTCPAFAGQGPLPPPLDSTSHGRGGAGWLYRHCARFTPRGSSLWSDKRPSESRASAKGLSPHSPYAAAGKGVLCRICSPGCSRGGMAGIGCGSVWYRQRSWLQAAGRWELG